MDNSLLIFCQKFDGILNLKKKNTRDLVLEIINTPELKNRFILIRGNYGLLNNNLHRLTCQELDRELLINFNCKFLDLNSTEMVVPLLELSQKTAKLYNKLYETPGNINSLINYNILSQYYNCENNKNFQNLRIKLSNIINNIPESDYWTLDTNIIINNNHNFMERFFNKLNNDKNNYIPKYSKLDITNLFAGINSDRLLYDIFNILLLSPEYTNLVLNNKFILDKTGKFFKSGLVVLYNYIFGYSWKIILDSGILFDINTANKLPVFPYNINNLNTNPYLGLNISSDFTKSDNFYGMPYRSDYGEYGISDLSEFKNKFNIFTSGLPDKNIFTGLPSQNNIWKNFALAGNIIPACVPRRNPLMDIIAPMDLTRIEKLNRFYSEYYLSEDLDLIYNGKLIFEFMDNISNISEIIKNNLSEIVGSETNLNIESNKILNIYITEKYIKNNLKLTDKFDPKSPTIREAIYSQYLTLKFQQNTQHRLNHKNNIYEHYYKFNTADEMVINILAEIKPNKTDNEIYLCSNSDEIIFAISESLKFKISSSNLNHNINIIQISESFEEYIKKYNLPVNRGYFDGDMVYLDPSCISALLTYTNFDITNQSNPNILEQINIYRRRGYGTILNNSEKLELIKYIISNKNWAEIYRLDPNTAVPGNISELRKNPKLCHIFGYKELDDNLYRIYKNNKSDLYTNIKPKYIYSSHDIVEYYKKKYNFNKPDFIFSTVDQGGNFNIFKKWLLEAAYSELY